MKKIYILSAAVLSILAAASCAKEENGPETFRTVISASLPSSKTALGEKDGDAWPNYWKAGDQISVNGVASEALGSEADGKATATFSFDGLISTPYNAIYPASAVSGYSDGSATVTLPASQNYVAGSYDPAAFIMGGKSTNEAKVSLYPCVSVIHLSLTGTASISKVKLTGAADAALSGSFTTDFTSYAPLAASNKVEMVAETPVALPAEFFIAVPAGLSGTLNVEVFDTDGGSMSKNATLKSALAPGQVYSPAALAYTASYDIAITAEGITSSTAIICWDNSPEAAYTIGVYEDEGCTSLLDSYAVDAGNACWSGESPRFCISGLDAGITCYVKVTNTAQNVDSNILPVTTAPFDVVEVSSNPADVGDVILAEDFGELRWDCDMIGVGAGWFPTEAAQASFSTVEVESFRATSTSGELQLSPQTNALAASRLMHWAQGANKNMYIHPGYIKLVGSNKVTHLVTPALNNIPEGMVATVEVEVTASAYYSESSGSFCTDKAIVAVQTGEIGELLADATNSLDLESNIASITLKKETAWNTYKVTLNGVSKGDRLAFGADKSVTKNDARMNISDMKVTIKTLYDAGTLTASVKNVSSSTIAFTWTHAGSASADIAKPYTIALYSDSACDNLVVSHEFDADASCWDGKIPCFVFGGLQPGTTYWFVVEDTESGAISEAVSATTEAFTAVNAADVTSAAVGDVLLAEDFSEIAHGPDEFAYAAGFVPSQKTLTTIPSGINPEGSFVKYNDTGNRLYGAGWDISGSRMENGWGFFGNSTLYSRNGYLRITTTAETSRTHLVTPKLSGIPDGKIATIKVTVTATKNEENENDVAVFVEKDLTMNAITEPTDAKFHKYTGASLSGGHALGISTVREWETKSVNIDFVDKDCQLVIGSLNNIPKYNRFSITDVKVEVVSLANAGPLQISDDATFAAFVNAAASNKSIDAIVTQDVTLDPATVAAFESIEDFEGSLDGDGHTISGLTKPLFDELKGTVENLTLNSTISSDNADDPIWGILAKQLSAGSVSGCTAKGSITYSATDPGAQAYIGGVVGKYSGGTLSGCYNEASITYSATGSNKIYIGGVVSNNEKSTLRDCHSTAGTLSVTGYSTVGAVYVGGVVGYDTKTIDSCTNAMTVDLGGTFSATSDNYFCAGGIAGKVTGGSISNCLNTGDVICSHKNSGTKGYTFVGGLVGQIKGTISNSSNGGTVSFTGKTDSQNPYFGGIVGSTDSTAGSITGKYSTASATNYGEVVVNTSSQSKKYVYVGGIAGRLHTSNTMTATNNGPITITKLTCTSLFLGGLAGYTNASSSVINAGSENMAGGDITVSGLTSKDKSYIGGLVGQNKAAVTGNNAGDVIVTSGTKSAKNFFVGGIVGSGSGPITACTNSAPVSNAAPMNDAGGYLQIGGIVGYNNSSTTITDCHNTGNVTNTGNAAGYLYVGGITSESDALISGCTNTGDVSNSGNSGNGHPICVGGITGVASANVENSSNGTDTQPGGTITNTGDSAEDICIGGVIGWNNNKTVTNCFNKGDVTNSGAAGNIAVGGVVGWSSATSTYVDPNTSTGTITNTGTASTAAYTGEIIGHQAE